jgi:hypothetical protein
VLPEVASESKRSNLGNRVGQEPTDLPAVVASAVFDEQDLVAASTFPKRLADAFTQRGEGGGRSVDRHDNRHVEDLVGRIRSTGIGFDDGLPTPVVDGIEV